MKPLNAMATLLMAAMSVVMLTACPSTSNNSSPAPAAVTPGTCTQTWNGTYVDQNGNPCTPTGLNYQSYYNSCNNYTWNPGMSYGCGGSQYVLPPTGYFNNGVNTYQIGGGSYGCQQWSYYYQQMGYNVWYVPVNVGYGQLVCVNFQYLQPYAQQYNSLYTNPQYWYQYPPTLYAQGYYPYGYSGYYPNYCASNLSLGFSTGGFGIGASLCF